MPAVVTPEAASEWANALGGREAGGSAVRRDSGDADRDRMPTL
jgi:hypothetical protein